VRLNATLQARTWTYDILGFGCLVPQKHLFSIAIGDEERSSSSIAIGDEERSSSPIAIEVCIKLLRSGSQRS